MLDFRAGGLFAGRAWESLSKVEKFVLEFRAYRAQRFLGNSYYPFKTQIDLIDHIIRYYDVALPSWARSWFK